MPHDGRALSVEDITTLADLTAAAITTSDLIPVYDASTGLMKTVPAKDMVSVKNVAGIATLASASVTTGDFVLVWDASAAAIVKVDATKFTIAS